MKEAVGVFASRMDAERAFSRLRELGIEKVSLFTPDHGRRGMEDVPTVAGEQPGTWKALGAVAGGALGTAAAGLFVPGVGLVLAIGLTAAALTGGAVAGAAAGGALENAETYGLPADELFIYEDALRQGRSVLVALAEDQRLAQQARELLAESGAESLDAARQNWWLGLRDAEAERYRAPGRDFQTDEMVYRAGFEAALRPWSRGRSYEQALDDLRKKHPDLHTHEAFRRGYERGRAQRSQWSAAEKRAA